MYKYDQKPIARQVLTASLWPTPWLPARTTTPLQCGQHELHASRVKFLFGFRCVRMLSGEGGLTGGIHCTCRLYAASYSSRPRCKSFLASACTTQPHTTTRTITPERCHLSSHEPPGSMHHSLWSFWKGQRYRFGPQYVVQMPCMGSLALSRLPRDDCCHSGNALHS